MTRFPDLLSVHVPACTLARPSVLRTLEGPVLQVHCAAPAELRAACGYPGRCPHKGPYYDMEDRAEETHSCLIRQALGLS